MYHRIADRAIDSHTHLWHWTTSGRPFYEELSGYRRNAGLDYCGTVCVPYVNHPVWRRDAAQNILGAILKLYDDRFYVFGGLVYVTGFPVKRPIPPEFSFKVQAEELHDIGMDGVKMLETKPSSYKMFQFPPNSPEYDPYYSYLEQTQTPLIWHVNDPESFWGPKENMEPGFIKNGWWFGDGTFASNWQVYDEVFDVLKRHPRLCVTFAHMLFLTPHPEKIRFLLESYPYVRFDLTPNPELFYDIEENYEEWREIFMRYPDRFILGSDASAMSDLSGRTEYLNDIIRFVETDDVYTAFYRPHPVHGLKLPPSMCDRILYANYASTVEASPRSIRMEALMAYIDKYLPYIAQGEDREHIVRFRQTGRFLP